MSLATIVSSGVKHDYLAEAEALKVEAFKFMENDELDKAHERLVKAIDIYRRFKGQEARISLCLYELSISYFNQRDLNAVQDILKDMEHLSHAYPRNPSVLYDYYSVLGAYGH